MVTPPIYQKASPENLLAYFGAIHEQSGLPIIIYNVLPAAPVPPETMLQIAALPGVIGTKESAGSSLTWLSELVETGTRRLRRHLGDRPHALPRLRPRGGRLDLGLHRPLPAPSRAPCSTRPAQRLRRGAADPLRPQPADAPGDDRRQLAGEDEGRLQPARAQCRAVPRSHSPRRPARSWRRWKMAWSASSAPWPNWR